MSFRHTEAKASQLERNVWEIAKISEMQTGELHDLVSQVYKKEKEQIDKSVVDYVKN